jgi:hypothetical protein
LPLLLPLALAQHILQDLRPLRLRRRPLHRETNITDSESQIRAEGDGVRHEHRRPSASASSVAKIWWR